jgi:hypothetical protein
MNARAALLVAGVIATVAPGSPASADTDWTAASAVWSAQLAELRQAQATIAFCNMSVERAVAAGLRRAERGLDQALGVEQRAARGPQGCLSGGCRSAGSLAAPCAPDSPLVGRPKAALSALQTRLVEQGTVKAAVPAEPVPRRTPC